LVLPITDVWGKRDSLNPLIFQELERVCIEPTKSGVKDFSMEASFVLTQHLLRENTTNGLL